MYTLDFFLLTLLSTLYSHFTSALPTTQPETAPQPLEVRDNYSVVRNELISGPCKPITVIFARGTSELGNVGSFAGPPFFNALSDLLDPKGDSKLAIQGVNYGATIAGYLIGGDPIAATTMASLAKTAATNCPNTQIVLGGYSQGAQVVHLAARKLTASVASKIRAVVLFGDPDDGDALTGISTGKTVTFCYETDLICDGAPIVLPVHLTYGVKAPEAAAFVRARVSV